VINLFIISIYYIDNWLSGLTVVNANGYNDVAARDERGKLHEFPITGCFSQKTVAILSLPMHNNLAIAK
jgi:hypothetical protein